jgi:hypothetical protein
LSGILFEPILFIIKIEALLEFLHFTQWFKSACHRNEKNWVAVNLYHHLCIGVYTSQFINGDYIDKADDIDNVDNIAKRYLFAFFEILNQN